jgi:hypothetical protein
MPFSVGWRDRRFHTEGEIALENVTGEVALALRGGDFAGRRLAAPEGEFDPVILDSRADLADVLQMASIEGVGEAEQGREAPDGLLPVRGEGMEVHVLGAGERLAMVSRDKRDKVALLRAEMHPLLPPYQSRRMLVVRRAILAHRPSDVMKACRPFKDHALIRAEPVHALQFIEEPHGQ